MIDIWNLKLWYDFCLRAVFVMGLFATIIFSGMQIWGWQLTLSLPTIEHTFKK